MARIRTVKPKLFTHEGLFDAEHETGLPLRLSFIGLFTEADREGRFQWRPRTLKAAILPFDDLDFEAVLEALVRYGFIIKYRSRLTRNARVKHASSEMLGCAQASFPDAENREFLGFIPTFTHHQAINNKEPPSELDAPSDTDLASLIRQGKPSASSTRKSRVLDASSETLAKSRGERKGREGVNPRDLRLKTERSSQSLRSNSRARENVAETETTNSLARKFFSDKGLRLTATTATNLDAAIAAGVTAASIGHALDVAMARRAGSPGAYAVTTALDWLRNGTEPPPGEPMPEPINAHSRAARQFRDRAFINAVTGRGPQADVGDVIDVETSEVRHADERGS
ncbi:hypothetical protein [Caballeronia cordobensis]|uniref:hypothetical protein n=1 Tax=Caballeronia cordobensis TaxID=1353886 RepID=UPI00045EF62A|nr:uncharacterized protein BRPE67_BCDS11390 [Burkholderia sp. RPE67]